MVDFIGVGAQKSGTTWLHAQLRQHPEVFFTPVKEVHFFDGFRSEKIRKRRLGVFTQKATEEIEALEASGGEAAQEEIARLKRAIEPDFAYTDPWYEHIFGSRPGKKGGDITPAYSTLRDEGVEHAKRVAPNAAIIYFVRDPIARGISSLKMMTREKSAEEILKVNYYFSHGDYMSAVPRWDRLFGDRVLYIPFADVRERPLDVLRTVEQHIGVGPHKGYTDLNQPISNTSWSTLEITDEIVAEIHRLFDPQYAFLKSRFGDDFMARIT